MEGTEEGGVVRLFTNTKPYITLPKNFLCRSRESINVILLVVVYCCAISVHFFQQNLKKIKSNDEKMQNRSYLSLFFSSLGYIRLKIK